MSSGDATRLTAAEGDPTATGSVCPAAWRTAALAPDNPAKPAPVLELRQVRKTYATGVAAVEALRGVDIVVETTSTSL